MGPPGINGTNGKDGKDGKEGPPGPAGKDGTFNPKKCRTVSSNNVPKVEQDVSEDTMANFQVMDTDALLCCGGTCGLKATAKCEAHEYLLTGGKSFLIYVTFLWNHRRFVCMAIMDYFK